MTSGSASAPVDLSRSFSLWRAPYTIELNEAESCARAGALAEYSSQHPTLRPPVSWSAIPKSSVSPSASANSRSAPTASSQASVSPRAAAASFVWPAWSIRPHSTIRKNPGSDAGAASSSSTAAIAISRRLGSSMPS